MEQVTGVKMTKQQLEQLLEQRAAKGKGKRTTRRKAKGDYHTICVLCREEFRTVASEDRHLNETGHGRYALVLVQASG